MKFAVTVALLVAAAPLAAQRPAIGIIDVYGARTVTAEQLRLAARIAVGDPITDRTEADVEQRLRALPNVSAATVDVVCCENGRSIVYIGVRERGDSTVFSYATPPGGDARLPANIVAAEQEFMNALQQAVVQGNTGESDSLGHSLVRYPPARAAQQKFLQYAAGNVARLRDVLHNSSDASHRALAAQVIAYALNKNEIIPDLVRALRDADPEVRNNATRALAVMAMYNQRNPAAMLRVPYEPFVDMMNSPVWTDRNKASFVLMGLIDAKNVAALNALRTHAFDALVDMVRWQSPGHAMPAAVILGRMASMSDDAIMQAFQSDRTKLIEAARARR
jgi:hypothetical protein